MTQLQGRGECMYEGDDVEKSELVYNAIRGV